MCSDNLTTALAADLDGHFERLVREYQDRLYGFALRLSGRSMDAEEIAQDAFLRAHHALMRYPAEQIRSLALRPWLFQITLNVFRNKRRGRRIPTSSLDEVAVAGSDDRAPPAGLIDDAATRPESVVEQRETRRDLAALLAALPERYRVPVVLRHVEGLSYVEVADLLGQPVGTVKSNVHRGTKLLRDALSKNAACGSARELAV